VIPFDKFAQWCWVDDDRVAAIMRQRIVVADLQTGSVINVSVTNDDVYRLQADANHLYSWHADYCLARSLRTLRVTSQLRPEYHVPPCSAEKRKRSKWVVRGTEYWPREWRRRTHARFPVWMRALILALLATNMLTDDCFFVLFSSLVQIM
jgi:hypothetical protein